MNVLDESVPEDQRLQLAIWRIRVRKIGIDVGRAGMQDAEIIPQLLRLTRPTFFTRDRDFYRPTLRHHSYCLVWVEVPPHETALTIRSVLRHPTLNTEAKRLGLIVHASGSGLDVWRPSADLGVSVSWR